MSHSPNPPLTCHIVRVFHRRTSVRTSLLMVPPSNAPRNTASELSQPSANAPTTAASASVARSRSNTDVNSRHAGGRATARYPVRRGDSAPMAGVSAICTSRVAPADCASPTPGGTASAVSPVPSGEAEVPVMAIFLGSPVVQRSNATLALERNDDEEKLVPNRSPSSVEESGGLSSEREDTGGRDCAGKASAVWMTRSCHHTRIARWVRVGPRRFLLPDDGANASRRRACGSLSPRRRSDGCFPHRDRCSPMKGGVSAGSPTAPLTCSGTACQLFGRMCWGGVNRLPRPATARGAGSDQSMAVTSEGSECSPARGRPALSWCSSSPCGGSVDMMSIGRLAPSRVVAAARSFEVVQSG
jgi:hypothetical protein